MNAAIVSIVSEWLGDIKMGYCSDGWWLNQQFCCWEIEGDEIDGCNAWHSWSHVTFARWIIFVLFAVSVQLDFCLNFFTQAKLHYALMRIDYVLIYRFTSRQVICKVCCWFWYLGNKVHSRWFCHARLPGFRNIFYQEYHSSQCPSFFCFRCSVLTSFFFVAACDCLGAVSR